MKVNLTTIWYLIQTIPVAQTILTSIWKAGYWIGREDNIRGGPGDGGDKDIELENEFNFTQVYRYEYDSCLLLRQM